MKKRVTKTLRNRFEENYVAVSVPANNKRGTKMKYVYYAPWYIWNLPPQELKKRKAVILSDNLISLMVFLLSVSLRTPLNNLKPVSLLSALAFCCHIMEIAALVEFIPSKNRSTKIRYEQINRGLGFFPALRVVLLTICTIACAISLPFGYFSAKALVVTTGNLLCSFLAWAGFKCFRSIPFTTEENDTLSRIGQQRREAEDDQ